MTVGDFLAQGSSILRQAGIDSARLDILILLEDALGKNRASLLAHEDDQIDEKTEVELNTKIAQRTRHVPLAYIRGQAPFFGRMFTTNPGVLVPRPETEALIELLKTLRFTSPPRIADVGAGSGCVGITAALELESQEIDLYDVDQKTLATAGKNAQYFGIRAVLRHENLLSLAKKRSYNVILANLPYVPTHYPINKAAQHEPRLAIFAGEDGLELYKRFWREIPELSHAPEYIITESFPSQHRGLTQFARAAGYKTLQTQGYAQLFCCID